jgi:ATP-dependent RNA helicase DDX49/DBP8
MAKTKRASEVNAQDEKGGMTLDPMEVMKAMLAQKGEGKQVESESESDDEEDEDEASDVNSDGEDEDKNDDEEDEEESNSEAESSRSAELRHAQKQSSPISRVPTSRVPPSTANPKQTFSSTKPPADTTFESLGLSRPLIAALASINIKKPTEIQSACLGPIMAGRDCIGGAKTGSGKTLAFALPIVERIARDPFGVWAVVLTPTR